MSAEADDPGGSRIHTRGKVCPRCRYELGGLQGERCPECGHDVAQMMIEGVVRPITDAEREAARDVLRPPSPEEARLLLPHVSETGTVLWKIAAVGAVSAVFCDLLLQWLPTYALWIDRALQIGIWAGILVAVVGIMLGFLRVWGLRFTSQRTVGDTVVQRQRAMLGRDLERAEVEEIRVTATHELVADSPRAYRVYLLLSNGWVLAIRDDAALWRVGPGLEVAGREVRLAVLPESRACVSLSTSGDPCRAVDGSRARPRVAPYRWASPAVFFYREQTAFRIPKNASVFEEPAGRRQRRRRGRTDRSASSGRPPAPVSPGITPAQRASAPPSGIAKTDTHLDTRNDEQPSR